MSTKHEKWETTNNIISILPICTCCSEVRYYYTVLYCIVAGSKAGNGSVNAEPRVSSAVAVKSDAGRRSGIPAEFPDHVEAGAGEAVSPPDMATEKKRGIFSMFRRKKDTKEIKPVVVITTKERMYVCMYVCNYVKNFCQHFFILYVYRPRDW